jgi:GT2 family glycosyltransferase
MQGRKKAAVVILAWNGREFLRQFLPSVIQFTDTNLYDIIVADNCSTDGTADFMAQNFPAVRVIQNTANTGFAGGYNEALKHVDAEYYILLNQDVEVTADWIEVVLAEMENNENIAAAQPKLRAYHNRQYFEYAGACGGYVDRFGYAFCRGRLFDTIEKDDGQYDTVKQIFWATGACMFVRKDVFWEAGGFDIDFFAHQEEIDLCWRINNMGYRIISVPASLVYHVGGGSLPQGNPRKTYLNFRNNNMMIFKNLPLAALCWKLPVRIFLDIVASWYSVIKNRNFVDFKAIFKAHGSLYKNIPHLIAKRQKLSQSNSGNLSNVNVVWEYFIKGKRKYSDLPL